MKGEDIKVGKVYTVRRGAETLILKVLSLSTTEEQREDGKKARTNYTFECQDPRGVGKVHTVRTPSHFIEEVERKPAPGLLVRVFKGKHKDSLGAETVHLVKEVKGVTAVISSGGREYRVRTDALRVVEDAPRETAGVFVSQTALEGEQCPDPTPGACTAGKTGPGSPSGSSAVGADDLTELVGRADAEDTDAQDDLFVKAMDCGYAPSEVFKVATWGEVAEMIRGRRRTRANPLTAVGGAVPTPGTPTNPTPSPRKTSRLADSIGSAGVRDTSPHVIVEARAGTGKTTTLVEGLKPLLGVEPAITPSPQQQAVWDAMAMSKGKASSFCFVAFNKSIAEELQRRVPHGVCAMTMHSMGFTAVKNAFGRGIKVESYRVSNIVAELMERDVRELRKSESTALLMRAVEELVRMCKMNLIGFGVEEGIVRTDGDLDEYWSNELDALVSRYELEIPTDVQEQAYSLVPRVLDRCKDVRADMEVDYDDMIWLPVVLGLRVLRYDMLIVDEAQDLNRCQQALAKRAGHRLVLCGDERQAIYGFAGADSDSLPRMFRELEETARTNGDERISGGCLRLPLTVTRRCGRKIVEEARKLVPDFEALPDAHEGRVYKAKYPDAKLSKTLTKEEQALNPDYTALVADGDFILCRCNAPLVSQCFRFLKMGRKATIQGRDIGKGLITLVEKFEALTVPDLVGKLSDWHHREQAKENAKRNPSEARIIALDDKYNCLLAFTEGMATVGDVVQRIKSVFTDERTSPGVRLSSIHRAKGLEARRVFFLMPESAPCPHYMAKSEWQIGQEWNLKYVAITRAIEELVYVC